jgi:hypothetical protein
MAAESGWTERCFLCVFWACVLPAYNRRKHLPPKQDNLESTKTQTQIAQGRKSLFSLRK